MSLLTKLIFSSVISFVNGVVSNAINYVFHNSDTGVKEHEIRWMNSHTSRSHSSTSICYHNLFVHPIWPRFFVQKFKKYFSILSVTWLWYSSGNVWKFCCNRFESGEGYHRDKENIAYKEEGDGLSWIGMGELISDVMVKGLPIPVVTVGKREFVSCSLKHNTF